jgi:hypothetical protein
MTKTNQRRFTLNLKPNFSTETTTSMFHNYDP